MSQGGDGTPQKAIRITVGDNDFVISEDKTVYWVVNLKGEMAKVGTCSRDGKNYSSPSDTIYDAVPAIDEYIEEEYYDVEVDSFEYDSI